VDPIYPILPTEVNIPPVTGASAAGRIEREKRRGGGGEADAAGARERRRRAQADLGSESVEDHDGDDPGGPHVDLIA
jgi:hypothetical protein